MRKSSYGTHVEKFLVIADEQRTFARIRRAEYRNAGRFRAQVCTSVVFVPTAWGVRSQFGSERSKLSHHSQGVLHNKERLEMG